MNCASDKNKKDCSMKHWWEGLIRNSQIDDTNASQISSEYVERELKDLKASTTSLSDDSGKHSTISFQSEYSTTSTGIVELRKKKGESFGIIIGSTSDLGTCPTISGLRPDSVAQRSDQLAPGDKIHSVNGVSTSRMPANEVTALLDQVDDTAHLEIEYSLPNYSSQNSLCVGSKITNITLERVDGSLGITLRGGANSTDPILSRPLVVTHVRPQGPAHRSGRIKVGDRVLRVDNHNLTNKSLLEAQLLLKQPDSTTSLTQLGSVLTTLTIEYDVNVMESVKYATGPLLVEIERHVNEELGLVLSDERCDLGTEDIYPAGIFIDRIIAASVADRCGALHVGDQILGVDDNPLEGSSITPQEVTRLLQSFNMSEGCSKLQILPFHVVSKPAQSDWENRGLASPSTPSISGYSTISRRRYRKRLTRQSSIEKGYQGSSTNYCSYNPQLGVCHTETLTVSLSAQEHVGYGIKVSTDNKGNEQAHIVIKHVINDSPAYRCGSLQVGDRILAVNHQYNLTVQEINSLLDLACDSALYSTSRIILQIEFDVIETIIPTSGVFNVKLAKRGPGLGITITASKVIQNDPFIISDIRRGSIAYRTGTLAIGDRLLAIDNRTLDHMSLESSFDLLQCSSNDIVTLKVEKSEREEEDTLVVYTLELTKKNGALGITICGSESCTEPVILAKLTEGGIAEKTGALHVGDRILAINGENLEYRPLSDAIRMLQTSGDNVQLRIARQYLDSASIQSHSVYEEGNANYPSPGLGSIDSAVESWDSGIIESINIDSQTGKDTIVEIHPTKKSEVCGARNLELRQDDLESNITMSQTSSKQGSHIQYYSDMENSVCPSPLPLPNYSFTNTLNSKYGSSYFICQKPNLSEIEYGYKMDDSTYSDINSTYELNEIHHVTLYKDHLYDDYGFSVSDGLYQKGVYINKIRKGGPAHMASVLRPYDRLLQVNDTKTADYDCCLTVPLIASSGDKIELIISRNPYINNTDEKEMQMLCWSQDEYDNSLMASKQFSSSQNTITKTL